jgi:hypothetical protein
LTKGPKILYAFMEVVYYMYNKLEKSNRYIANILVIALTLSSVLIAVTPVTAADVSVIRDLPDESVYPEDEISVSLNQSGFFITGLVTETLPEGFTCTGLASGSGGTIEEYDTATNTLKVGFGSETTITYLVETGTAEQIESAVFSGTWSTMDATGKKINGDVGGDTTLTLGEGPKPTPTPTPTPTPSNGGGNGGGNGGVTTPTPTATTTTTPTATPGETTSPGATPSATVTPPSSPTLTPGATPTGTAPSSPTSKPFIPGFETVFALAGLLAVAYVLKRR